MAPKRPPTQTAPAPSKRKARRWALLSPARLQDWSRRAALRKSNLEGWTSSSRKGWLEQKGQKQMLFQKKPAAKWLATMSNIHLRQYALDLFLEPPKGCLLASLLVGFLPSKDLDKASDLGGPCHGYCKWLWITSITCQPTANGQLWYSGTVFHFGDARRNCVVKVYSYAVWNLLT